MKVQVTTLALVALLLVGNAAAGSLKLKKAIVVDTDVKTNEKPVDNTQDNEDAVSKDNEKEVHKRGILLNGGLSAYATPLTAGVFPKTYAAHYGYSLKLPSSAAFVSSPAFVKYSSGLHYKPTAAFAATYAPSIPHLHAASVPHLHAFSAAAPAFAATPAIAAPAVATTTFAAAQGPHVHATPAFASAPAVGTTAFATAQVPHVHATPAFAAAPAVATPAVASTPYVLRPGGAFVQSYSATFPRAFAKPAFAAVQPVRPVAPVHLHTPVQQLQPVQPVQTVQPVQSIPAVQVQQTFSTPQQFPHPFQPNYFQTTFVQQQETVPVAPAPAPSPAPIPAPVPVLPSFVAARPPAVAGILPNFRPTFAAANPPSVPASVPAPVFPGVQTISPPTLIPSPPAVAPAFPQAAPAPPQAAPAFPNFPLFPGVVQSAASPPPAQPGAAIPSFQHPPLAQQPPTFIGFPFQPAATPEFTGFPQNPSSAPVDSGSAEAAPQIPVQPIAPQQPPVVPESAAPEPPKPTEQPWRPMFYAPPNPPNTAVAATPANRPSVTLLPPYGSQPEQG